jgi:hypothetical protein
LPKVDLSSWLKNAIPILQSPVISDYEAESTTEFGLIGQDPFMSSYEDRRFTQDLPLSQYGELSENSKHGSPLSQSCFGEEESCFIYQTKGSTCDELCILSDYEDTESTNSNDQASFVNCMETFDTDRFGSVQTSQTTFFSPQASKLSIMCQGEYVLANEATLAKRTSIHWLECVASENTFNCGNNKIECGECLPEGWLDSDSSQSGYSSTEDEILDVRIFLLQPVNIYQSCRTTFLTMP